MSVQGVISKYPSFYRPHEGLARVYQSKKQLHQAEEEAKTAVALRSDEGTLEVLASIYSDEKDTLHAHKFWKAVLHKNPKDIQAQRHLGLLNKEEEPDNQVSRSGEEDESDDDETGAAAGKKISGALNGVDLEPMIAIAILGCLLCLVCVCVCGLLYQRWHKP